jgi:predicted transcriptional regulator of viral defense system
VSVSQTVLRLADLAEDQYGLLTRRQAEGAGISQATITRLVNHGLLDRVTHGVYRLVGTAPADHQELRAAWLQLAPETPTWERRPAQGVVSFRSAAALYGIGHLPADRHEFTLPGRRQTRRPDVRLHVARLDDREWTVLRGLLVTRPARTAADLLGEREDLDAVAHLVADAIRAENEPPGAFVLALAPHAARLGLPPGDGMATFGRLLDLVGDRDTAGWLAAAGNTS